MERHYLKPKCALNFHVICTKRVQKEHRIWCFFGALLTMFITKVFPICTNYLNYPIKFAPELVQICPKKQQNNRCKKGTRYRNKSAIWYGSHKRLDRETTDFILKGLIG